MLDKQTLAYLIYIKSFLRSRGNFIAVLNYTPLFSLNSILEFHYHFAIAYNVGF